MSLVIPVAHDFNCPWCWIGLSQVRRLRQEFDVTFDWLAYELFPDELEWPESTPAPERNPDKPKTPTRFQLALAAEGLDPLTSNRPHHMRTHYAHEAVEFAKLTGKQDELIETLYEAHWLMGEDINQPDNLVRLAAGIVAELEGLREAVTARRFADKIVPFDDAAYASGVYNVPTFWIGGERYAEQTYRVLRQAVVDVLNP